MLRPVKILVVDDDYTCSSVIGGILKAWKYEVEVAENGVEALSILYSEEGVTIDGVVADVHMPVMNGFELQKHVIAEFPNIPVFLMSADHKTHTVLQGLNGGAVLFMHKPVSTAELKNIWQFIYRYRRSHSGKAIMNELTENFSGDAGGSSCGSTPGDPHSIAVAPAAMQFNKGTSNGAETTHIRDPSRMFNARCVQPADVIQIGEAIAHKDAPLAVVRGPRNNPKLVWTAELHNKFLGALHILGLEKAQPKTIHQVMNVAGLTRANVASHLQKYRHFLKRMEEVSTHEEGRVIPNRSFTSIMSAGYVPLYYRLQHIDPADEPRLRKMLQEDLIAMRDPFYMAPSSQRYSCSGSTNYFSFRLGSGNHYNRGISSHLDYILAATGYGMTPCIGDPGVMWAEGKHPMAYNEVEDVTAALGQLQMGTPVEGFPTGANDIYMIGS